MNRTIFNVVWIKNSDVSHRKKFAEDGEEARSEACPCQVCLMCFQCAIRLPGAYCALCDASSARICSSASSEKAVCIKIVTRWFTIWQANTVMMKAS
jgi:hypothetical protein